MDNSDGFDRGQVVREAERAGEVFTSTVFREGAWHEKAWERILRKLTNEGVVAKEGGVDALYRFFVFFRGAAHFLHENQDEVRAQQVMTLALETLTSSMQRREEDDVDRSASSDEIALLCEAHVGLGIIFSLMRESYPGIK